MATRSKISTGLPRVEIGPDGFPIFIEPPSPELLRALKPSINQLEITQLKTLYGLDDPAKMLQAQIKFLDRFGITPGTRGIEFNAALEQLSGTVASNKVVLGEARRISESTFTNAILGGNYASSQELIYSAENDEPCPNCAALDGETGTYAELAAQGILPEVQCYGGSACQCKFWPYE